MHRTIKKTKKKTTISSAKKINEKEKRERKTYTLKYLQSKFIEKREKEKIFSFYKHYKLFIYEAFSTLSFCHICTRKKIKTYLKQLELHFLKEENKKVKIIIIIK
jgi:hypothetical protein